MASKDQPPRSLLHKVREKAGCSHCGVRRYTDEAARCQDCEWARAWLSCRHRHPPQLRLNL